jgi:hypothetical protein
MFFVEPLGCYRRGDIDLVFVIAEQNADFLAEHLTAEIFHRHMRGDHRTISSESSKEASHIGQDADIDARFARLLRPCCERPCCRCTAEKRDELASFHCLSQAQDKAEILDHATVGVKGLVHRLLKSEGEH